MLDLLIIAPLLVLVLSILFAILGLGGASIYVPLFYWLGLPLEQAISLGLCINIVTTALATAIFHRRGLLGVSEYQAASFILLGALIGAPIGVWISTWIPPHALVGLFALVLLLIAVRLLLPTRHSKAAGLEQESGAGFAEEAGGQVLNSSLRRVAMGSGSGALSGTLGIGGGVFLAPLLIDSGVNPRRAAVLSHICTLIASILGFVGHWLLFGALPTALLLVCALAAAIGSYVGSSELARGKISSSQIRLAFVCLLVLFSIKLALDFLGLGGAPFVFYD